MTHQFSCVYCGKIKPEKEKTREHIIPKFLLGAPHPTNPFIVNNVCERCNNLCGLYVDRQFTHNYLIHSIIGLSDRKFANIENGDTILPVFIGSIDIPPIVDLDSVCDVWLGPTGDRIFHFHQPYSEEYCPLGMVKPPANKVEPDPGFAIVYVRASNPVWHPTIARSILKCFDKKIDLYAANFNPREPFMRVTEDISVAKSFTDTLFIESDTRLKLQFSIDVGYEERFLAKLVLGFGAKSLNNNFLRSSYAKMVREVLWTPTTSERGMLPLNRINWSIPFTSNNATSFNALDHADLIIVALMPIRFGISMYVSLFGQKRYLLKLSDQPNHWPLELPQTGICFIAARAINQAVGPIDIMHLIGSSRGHHTHSSLKSIFEKLSQLQPTKPSYD